MPFAKRAVEPQLLCRRRVPAEETLLLQDLVSISSLALSRTLLQLSDLAKHACSIFQELESELAASSERVQGLQGRIRLLQESCSELDPKQEAVPVSNLDVESKLSTHYQAPWLQQRNVFQPSTRPACVDELHRRASFSPRAVQQDQRNRAGSRERRVSISSLPPLYPPPQPAWTTPEKRFRDAATQLAQDQFESTRSSSPTECCRFSPWSRKAPPPDLDSDGVALGHRSKFPISNTPSTLDKQTNWTKALPLPTPEERMKCNSQVITSCVIPINVTGVGFDRDASVRCSLVHSQSVLQRRRKLRRRRTVAGVPRQLQQDFDSDESPGSRERTVVVHSSPGSTPFSHLNTRDSGCQTEDFLVSGASRRRIRAQRGQGVSLSLSHSAGNITSLPDAVDAMFTASVGLHLRSRSLPRDTSRMMDNGHHESDDDNEEEELSSFTADSFLPGPMELILKDEEQSADEQAATALQLGGLKYEQLSASPERHWMERARSHLPRQADLGSCEISSSSDTFSSPVHSVSAAGVLGSPMDHKDDHQSSSGNWSGSSSTCPSQTSETIPPAASPPLTGSSHCDSELSLNAAGHATDDHAGFLLDHYPGLRTQRAGSFSSTAMDILEEVGVGAPGEGDWTFSQPEPSREVASSLGCPSFTSMATCESSYSDKPPSEKADTVSHYSVDTEGYYTSMHFDCGLKGSRSFTYNNFAPCGSERSLSELSGHMSLGRRCLSLRKAKAKPSPPKRSSSLRKICSEGNIPDQKEPKITCGQQLPVSREKRLQLRLSGSPGPVLSEPLVLWGVERSNEFPDLGVLSSTDAHSFKDEGAVQSDYADLWLLNDLKSSDPYRSLSNSSTATGTTVIECIRSQESSESQSSLSGSRATTPSLPSVDAEFKLTSPEKLAGLASPSSGYSSQSETPTSSFPSTFFPGPLSPASSKRKPKVPERKSSLSSVSLQSPFCRDEASSQKDLELPATPPSHLHLSALHSVNKASASRTQIQSLHPNKAPAKHSPPSNSEVFSAHSLSITPSVLHSVQLRSVRKNVDDQPEAASRLFSPTVNNLPTHQPVELRSSSPYNFHRGKSSKESWDSAFTSNNEFTSGGSGCGMETRSELDRDPPSESERPAALRSEDPPAALRSEDPPAALRSEDPPAGLEAEGSPEPALSSQSEASQQQEPEPSEGGACPSPLVLHSSPQRASSVQEASTAGGESEALPTSPAANDGSDEAERESSGVLAESVSNDGKEKTEEDSSRAGDTSPPNHEPRLEDDGVFLSPTKARTTEDLFAMIHRSKRKVLGRKDSSELRSRLGASGSPPPGSTTSSPVSMVPSASSPAPPPASSSSSSPSTPALSPASSLSPAASQRVSGPIYRNAKKSSTSNEEFKLLLLKKGSRSDSSYRMSATEILKSPVAPKSPGDPVTESPQQPEEPGSPPQPSGSPYPRANAESFSPKPWSAPSRPGRSRIPPPASSSRYGARGRLYSAPMQAISEGEAENSDGSPHDERAPQGAV